MKKLFTSLFFLASLSLFAQDSSTSQHSRFSIGVEAGAVSTFLNIPDFYYYYFDCIGCFPQEGVDFNQLPNATPAFQATLTMNYQLKPRHQLGLGFVMSQYGESHYTFEYRREVINFRGITARHRFKLLTGRKIDLLLSNSFNLEFSKGNKYYVITHTGLSHTGAITWSLNLHKRFSVELSMVGKTALTKYADYAWEGRNNRFGTGMLAGLTYRI